MKQRGKRVGGNAATEPRLHSVCAALCQITARDLEKKDGYDCRF